MNNKVSIHENLTAVYGYDDRSRMYYGKVIEVAGAYSWAKTKEDLMNNLKLATVSIRRAQGQLELGKYRAATLGMSNDQMHTAQFELCY